jgi:hypothetical protein
VPRQSVRSTVEPKGAQTVPKRPKRGWLEQAAGEPERRREATSRQFGRPAARRPSNLWGVVNFGLNIPGCELRVPIPCLNELYEGLALQLELCLPKLYRLVR